MTTLAERAQPEAPHVTMRASEFADFAREMKWDERTITLLLKPPVHHKPFFIGNGNTMEGRWVTLTDDRVLDFRH